MPSSGMNCRGKRMTAVGEGVGGSRSGPGRLARPARKGGRDRHLLRMNRPAKPSAYLVHARRFFIRLALSIGGVSHSCERRESGQRQEGRLWRSAGRSD
jgi:hypothetical protein